MAKKSQKAPAPQKARETRAAGTTRAPARSTGPAASAPAEPPADRTLDGAVDSLRRLLSELLEHRLDVVARDLAEVRRALAAGAEPTEILDRLDALLDQLGAVRFSAEPLDVIDPLIHTVVAERPGNGAPRGVVLEGVRPGFRTSRGLVLAKAAVAVSAG